jgi:hypothetical protein
MADPRWRDVILVNRPKRDAALATVQKKKGSRQS